MYSADNFYWAPTGSIEARTESPSTNLLLGVPLRTIYHRATFGFSNVLIPAFVVDHVSQGCDDFFRTPQKSIPLLGQ